MSQIGKGERGFTLIEVVCILALLALMAAIVWPAQPTSTSRPRMERLAIEIAAFLKTDRAGAMRAQVEAATIVGERMLTSRLQNKRIALPSDVTLELFGEGACRAAHAVLINASGLSCVTRLRLAGPSDAFDILINSATGGIEIAASR